ncbi:MAG: hypothetical protein RR036_00445 [Oscillospiraceae bacterium]
MTARQILKSALSLTSTIAADSDVDEFALDWLNTAISECLCCENSIRQAKKMPILTTAPLVLTLDENVDYSDNLCRVSLPYSLASCIFLDANDGAKYAEFRNRFIASLSDFAKISFKTGGE